MPFLAHRHATHFHLSIATSSQSRLTLLLNLKMDSTAPPPAAQGQEQAEQAANDQANTQQSDIQQPNTQPHQSQPDQQQPKSAAAAAAAPAAEQTPASIPAPELNALPQGDLTNLSLPGLPTDMSLLPMVGPDGNLLSNEELMNMPLMVPMMMDGSGMMNMPSIPQNNITNGRLSYRLS